MRCFVVGDTGRGNRVSVVVGYGGGIVDDSVSEGSVIVF